MASSTPEETKFRFLTVGAGPNSTGAWTDNGTASNGAQTDNASGAVVVPLKGSKAIASLTNPDPDDAVVVWASKVLQDIYWRSVAGDKQWAVEVRGDCPDGVPSVNDNVAFGILIANEASPIGSTVDGLIVTLECSLANVNPRIRYHTFTNGVAGGAVNSTAGATTAAVLACLRRSLTGAGTTGSITPSLGIAALDTSGVPISGAGVTAGNAVTSIGTGTWYIIPFCYRTLVSDTDTISPAFRAGYSVGVQKVA